MVPAAAQTIAMTMASVFAKTTLMVPNVTGAHLVITALPIVSVSTYSFHFTHFILKNKMRKRIVEYELQGHNGCSMPIGHSVLLH